MAGDSMGRVIFHIDLNSFFASAEIMRNSALAGQPLAISGLSRRAVVSTASYEARKYGVHSAMPLHQALEKCPDLVVVQGDYAWYEQLSERFLSFIRSITPLVEQASIDECYADMSEVIRAYKRPLDLAWIIQKRLYEELKLPCSIGIGPNKFLAKMASDMHKPMGITILRKQEIAKKLWPLPIGSMIGIGKKSTPLLEKAGIETIGDLADPTNENRVMQILGKASYQLIQNARGNGTNVLTFSHSVQSISRSTTLDKDTLDDQEIRLAFQKLCHALVQGCREEGVVGKMISITIRYFDFKNIVRSASLEHYSDRFADFYETALLLFDNHHTADIPIRHLGVTLGTLASTTIQQLDLFTAQKAEKIDVLEELNAQLSTGKLVFASSLLSKKDDQKR